MITVLVSIGVIIALLAVWASSRDPWWHVTGFGCPQGYYRIDGGRVNRVQGACGGLSPTGISLTLKPGETIDVHMFGYSTVKTSDPSVMRPFTRLSDLSSQHFGAVSAGTAVLSTATRRGLCGRPTTEPVPAAELAPTKCPVFVVAVTAR